MRTAHLAARLSRAGVKLTTLDVMLRAQENARQRELVREEPKVSGQEVAKKRSLGLSLDD